jgi:hypothetical protein
VAVRRPGVSIVIFTGKFVFDSLDFEFLAKVRHPTRGLKREALESVNDSLDNEFDSAMFMGDEVGLGEVWSPPTSWTWSMPSFITAKHSSSTRKEAMAPGISADDSLK